MLNAKKVDAMFNVDKNGVNYKGIYYEDEPEQMYFEGGSHFSHFNLCNKLEEIILTLSPDRRGKCIYDTPNLSNSKFWINIEISDSNTNADTRKIASDNSKEMIKKDICISKKADPNQRNKANNNFINNNTIVVKTSKSGGKNLTLKENYKKIQPKNFMYNNSLKLSDKVSSMKLQ